MKGEVCVMRFLFCFALLFDPTTWVSMSTKRHRGEENEGKTQGKECKYWRQQHFLFLEEVVALKRAVCLRG